LAIFLFPISIFLYFYGARRLCIFTDRIGHLAIEPDTLLKAQILGLIKPRKWFILSPFHRTANQHLISCWKKYFVIFQSKWICFLLNALSLWPFLRYNVSHFINNDKNCQLAYEINQKWGTRLPILTLTSEDETFAKTQLCLLGLPKEAWFVCVHAREGGFSPVDEVLHSHRNGKIENLLPAIQEIVKRGGWVIRLGDPTMAPLKKMDQVIDYAHHPLRSARLDILLCAKARFILGNTSGIFLVGSIFGVPSALANMIPMPTLGFLNNDVSIPKLYRKNNNTYVTFKELLSSPVSTFRIADLYQKSGLIVEENSSQDILFLTQEMLDRVEGRFKITKDKQQLHDTFLSLFQPRHYSYGAASNISVKFLEQYQHLL
jgi:putative glycosyltransferase (TIGR04372 family)